MPDPAPTPTLPPWGLWHSLTIVGIATLFVWMAIWLPWGLHTSWLVTMAALVVFVAIVGQGVTGRWAGALVDDRNRVSLSRLQMLVWTILVVSAFGTIAVARLWRPGATAADLAGALDVGVPQTVWFLLGISTTSFLGSPLIKNAKKDPMLSLSVGRTDQLLADQGKDATTVVIEGQLVKNPSIDQASLADIFMGETVENTNRLDIGKIQMFLFTLLLVLAYGVAIGALMRSPGVPSTLPDIGDGMLPLLGLSHGAYLMSKASASVQPTPGGGA